MLEQKANYIRRRVLDIVYHTKHGHIGGSFSCTDILTYIYYEYMTDELLILSKGHACLPLYVILEDKGVILDGSCDTFCSDGALLGGHPDITIPGITCETGSLGHGLGIAAGLALGGRKVIVVIGDGELCEGSVWEALMFIAYHSLNVILVVDKNNQVVCNYTGDINCLNNTGDMMESAGWEVVYADGHDFGNLRSAFRDYDFYYPLCIVANTIKGKGVSYMEGQLRWHHSIPTDEEYQMAVRELNGHND